MWRAANISIGALLLAATIAASFYGMSLESARADRFLVLEMSILGWGFAAQIVIMAALVLVTLPWDLEAAKAEQRAISTPTEGIRWTIRKFRDAADLRRAPGVKNKAHAILMTSYLWVFVAWICVFISMVPTIATCEC